MDKPEEYNIEDINYILNIEARFEIKVVWQTIKKLEDKVQKAHRYYKKCKPGSLHMQDNSEY